MTENENTQYMVIETFHPGCLDQVYQRFNQQGRLLPQGLRYINSWLQSDGKRCFQLMETNDASLFDQWICRWNDLTDFEIIELGDKPDGSALT